MTCAYNILKFIVINMRLVNNFKFALRRTMQYNFAGEKCRTPNSYGTASLQCSILQSLWVTFSKESNNKEPSIKDIRKQGRGEFIQSGQEGKVDSSDADVRTFWRKNFEFFEIYGVSAQTRRGRGSVFRDFVQTFFMDGPWTRSKAF